MRNVIKTIPFASSGQRVRDQLLVILSEEFPLTVKELYNRISRQGHEVSYQAVHKVVVQLQQEGIVEKKDKGLQLSKEWIHKVKDYAFTVDTIYTSGKKYQLPKTFEKPFTVVFDDISTYIMWMTENLRDCKFTQGKKEPIYGIFRHALWPLRFNFMDFELLREMAANRQTRGVCICNTPFDQWISMHYKLAGIKAYKIGVKAKLDEDYFAEGDNVIRVKFSPETIAFLDKVYSKIGDLKQLFNYYFTEGQKNTPMHIEVTIEHNPTLARMIENQIKHYLEDD